MFSERLRTLVRIGGGAARMLACLATGPLHRSLEDRPLSLAWQGTPVRITRGAHGVPRIEASSEAALYFGQGNAVATDRLWQMDMFRRQALGRLSEVLGAGTVAIDRSPAPATRSRSTTAFRGDATAPDSIRNLPPCATPLRRSRP